MELRQALVRNLQSHTARGIHFNQVDKVPRNRSRWNFFCDALNRSLGRDSLQQPPHRSQRAHFHLDGAHLSTAFLRQPKQRDIVDSHNFSAMHIDNLLIHQVAIQQQQRLAHAERPGMSIAAQA